MGILWSECVGRGTWDPLAGPSVSSGRGVGDVTMEVRDLGEGWALGPSPGRDPQGLLHVLVDHVGDAHGWDNLHEVGGNAPVEAPHALLGQDVTEQTQHGQLGGSLDGGW